MKHDLTQKSVIFFETEAAKSFCFEEYDLLFLKLKYGFYSGHYTPSQLRIPTCTFENVTLRVLHKLNK